ncbi:MAG: IS1634 family transposase [Dehalococcoidales bacterium]|nr:IS1634 family transposase [Dehalococcoidales bacterium]
MTRNPYHRRRERPPGRAFNPRPAKAFKFKVEKILGSLYLIKPLLERMDIQAIVDSIVPDRKINGQILTAGQVTEILVANRLHSPLPMKDIELWAELCGIEQLFEVESYRLNDDRIGRDLDDLAEYYDEIQTAVALHVIQEFGLKPEQVLWDTTSIYFEGDYDGAQMIQFGHGERPDLKQVKISLSIEKNSGVPLLSDIIEGNLNDQSIVVNNMKALLKHLKTEDVLFTGDSAVGTIPNCLLLNHNKIRFIAPCPASRLFDQAIDSVTQEELDRCVFPDKDGTAKFKVVERGVYIYPQNSKQRKELESVPPFWARCLLIWSKSKAKLEREKRKKYMAVIKERLTDIATNKLNTRRYKDQAYAQEQVDKCFQGSKNYLRKVFGTPTIQEKDASLKLVYTIDEALLAALENKDGIYPVVTNVYDYEKYTTEDLFQITRKKYNVEQPMRYLKSKIKVRPIFLHIEERIRGLTLVTFMALMAYCILEHLAKQNIGPKATTHQLIKEFAAIVFSEGEMLDGTYFYTVGNVNERHINLIRMLGLAVGSYDSLSTVQLE